MTGRRLYDTLTDAWGDTQIWERDRGAYLQSLPPAWAFLHVAERRAFNAAARKLTPKKAKRS